MRTALGILLLLSLAGCQSSQPTPSQANQCSGERPQVCTMEYNPVCADLAAGGQKTYASPCNACADDAVTGYELGECPE
ncbi:hypothetical protein BST95_00835 [Halioglobus japonicus]|uniref:Kazal-like domain-containing protein n=1 Tax=Halioglobus japonicus TaxID=930805 RepID=A0AAP8MBP8_9GAMM|nr:MULTISPECIES: hypothetical protein [Halioglobus]AQA16980.1 hypothetical protein BST95_00835 [Halioglobus japonicus]KZX58556.1 hypothetical protein A3709_18215 [Halioglobus sp. HI00S01]PLW84867.1 hypothetical protein C0029_17895 [Halioglobus japonicus]GHD21855.1 hypothetical protein GCM10007052_33130 [Halioglobus japonicus]